MQTLRLNSRGSDVVTLQKLLNITPADGIFGPKTDAAVRAYQRAKNLTPDGIVGQSTWTVLLTHPQSIDPSIAYDPLKTHYTRYGNRPLKYIAIHYTAGRDSRAGAAQRNRKVFDTASASADFVVDDTTILQCNPDIRNNYCWAVGDKKNPYSGGGQLNGKANNLNTISIELCSNLAKGASPQHANHNGWSFTEATLSNARRLVRLLMQRYNIPLQNVVRHYDITGKLCPGIPGWNRAPLFTTDGKQLKQANTEEQWQTFKDSLK